MTIREKAMAAYHEATLAREAAQRVENERYAKERAGAIRTLLREQFGIEVALAPGQDCTVEGILFEVDEAPEGWRLSAGLPCEHEGCEDWAWGEVAGYADLGRLLATGPAFCIAHDHDPE